MNEDEAIFASYGLKKIEDDKGNVRYIPLESDGPAMRFHKKVKKVFPRVAGCGGCADRARKFDAFIKGAIKNATQRQIGRQGLSGTEAEARTEPPAAAD